MRYIILLFFLYLSGNSFCQKIMVLTGKDLLSIVSSRPDTMVNEEVLISIDPKVYPNTTIHKGQAKTLLDDSVQFLYKEGKDYYLMKQSLLEYPDAKSIKVGQNTQERKTLSDRIRETKKLPCVIELKRDGKIIESFHIEFDVFI